MIRISQISIKPEYGPEEVEAVLEKKIRKKLRLEEQADFRWQTVKCSVDARKKPEIFLSYTVDVTGLEEQAVLKRCKDKSVSRVEPVTYRFSPSGGKELSGRPVIVGTGPAGLFCGYMLALHGYRPVLLERGRQVEERCSAVESFWEDGVLDTECNVQFGEGGAGTFSDGKLNTLVKDKEGRNREVLRIFVEAGAPASILYEGKPHIGTDILVNVVKHMRQTILAHGGEVRFGTKMTKLLTENGRVTGILAVAGKGVQERNLPPAVYKLTAQTGEGRGVYSFCMCPGGYVVNASSEEGRLAVNGMSYRARDGKNANSAVVVSVTPTDYGSTHPLGGLAFQRRLEEKAFEVGDGKVPVERYGDFKRAVCGGGEAQTSGSPAGASGMSPAVAFDMSPSAASGTGQTALGGCGEYGSGRQVCQTDGDTAEFTPQIKGQWKYAPVHRILPEALNRAFVEGMEAFGRTMDGFSSGQALLSGIESRTSSPVRIHRDASGQSEIRGLYPCGEGAGYAGGITSAAMDGIRIAEQIAKQYRPMQE